MNRDQIRLWQDAELPGRLELLRAACMDHRYPAHSHDQFVIAVFKNGAQKHKIARHSGIAYAGSVMVIPPGEVHTGESAQRNQLWEYCAYYPDAATLERIADDILGGSGELTFGQDVLFEDRVMATHLLAAHHTAETSPDVLERQCAVIDAFALLIRRYGQRRADAPQAAPRDGDIRRALDFLHESFVQRVTVDQIAGASGLSNYHFMRTFRAKTGLPAHRYVTQLRLKRAKELLAQGVGAAAAATDAGFFDQSHLINRFRDHFGVTPKEYAQACR